MELFDQLTADDKTLLVRLPVRVGFWISHADDTGGDAAKESEDRVICTMITAYAEDYLKSEFVQRLMEHTVAAREEWPRWLQKLEQVPTECGRVAQVLNGKINPRDLNTFKHNLLDIGMAVAMAFSEVRDMPKPSPLHRLLHALSAGVRTATPDERISVLEYQALKEIAAAMGLNSTILNSAV